MDIYYLYNPQKYVVEVFIANSGQPDTLVFLQPQATVATGTITTQASSLLSQNIITLLSSSNPPPSSPGAPQVPAGSLSVLDSSTTPLDASGTYETANMFIIGIYEYIVGSVYSDQAGTLQIQQSQDSLNWDIVATIQVQPSNISNSWFKIDVTGTWGRLLYTNGSTAQTEFRLYALGR